SSRQYQQRPALRISPALRRTSGPSARGRCASTVARWNHHRFGCPHSPFINPPTPVSGCERSSMATFVRNRVLNQLSWSSEDDSSRAARREALCELDGLLTQLEEINLRGGAIPTRVLVALRRRGVAFRGRVGAADLIEAIFAA